MANEINTTVGKKYRHPEKRNKPDNPIQRKPDWIRVKAPTSQGYRETRDLMRKASLNTVCEEASCPNIGECWEKKHATFMIMGGICTRACSFCNVATGKPDGLDQFEPYNVAQSVKELKLKHVVITSVDRDDLEDGGAEHYAETIRAVRKLNPETTIEVLTPDFKGNIDNSVKIVVDAKPDVFNHNIETIPRLYPTVRPGARYFGSLQLLSKVKELDPTIFTKSGLMVGLGESELEIHQLMDDLRAADVDFMTIGQYLAPTPKHHPVERFVTPAEFKSFAVKAKAKGFLLCASSPLTRSSYHAGDDFEKLREARIAKMKNKVQ